METTIYAVRVSGDIAKRGTGHDTRRRAGMQFSPEEVLVSLGEHEGAEQITEEQLEAILGDEALRKREIASPARPVAPAREPEPNQKAEEVRTTAEPQASVAVLPRGRSHKTARGAEGGK